MTDLRDAEPRPIDDSPGYCCVMAGMHMGHDEDCPMHEGECEHVWVFDWEERDLWRCAKDGCDKWLTINDVTTILNEHTDLKREAEKQGLMRLAIQNDTSERIYELEQDNTDLKRENEAFRGEYKVLRETVQQAVEKIYDEDDPDVAKPWLVENVLGLLVEALAVNALLEAEQVHYVDLTNKEPVGTDASKRVRDREEQIDDD